MIRLLQGDCREVLKTLPAASVQCCVTSPPYFGLRDYGVDGQIGLEASPDAFVAEMVAVFRELRRVLRDDGTLWLNLGDSYAANRGSQVPDTKHIDVGNAHGMRVPNGLKPKDLMGIPWMVAFALRADGWWLRKDIIWAKPNPMPESATDRPTSSHEHVFLLAKSGSSTFWTHRDLPGTRDQPEPDYRWINRQTGEERDTDQENNLLWRKVNLWEGHDYFFDGEAVREAGESGPSDQKKMAEGLDRIGGKHKTLDDPLARASAATNMGRKRSVGTPGTRNIRDVWTIATTPLQDAHFATFPPDLPERCIRAGTSERGCCATCGAPWARAIIKGEPDMAHRLASGASADGEYRGQSTKGHDGAGVQNASDVKRRILEGMREKTYEWRPTCSCGAAAVPCTVIDCFSGAGTTALVADRLGRHAIGIELSEAYNVMARQRMEKDAGLFAEIG